jgi:hypothetical protein
VRTKSDLFCPQGHASNQTPRVGDDGEATSVRRRRAHAGLGGSDHGPLEQGGQLVSSGIAKGADDHRVGTLHELRCQRGHGTGSLVDFRFVGREGAPNRAVSPSMRKQAGEFSRAISGMSTVSGSDVFGLTRTIRRGLSKGNLRARTICRIARALVTLRGRRRLDVSACTIFQRNELLLCTVVHSRPDLSRRLEPPNAARRDALELARRLRLTELAQRRLGDCNGWRATQLLGGCGVRTPRRDRCGCTGPEQ